jgi:uncharacterized protein (DUF1501 family)
MIGRRKIIQLGAAAGAAAVVGLGRTGRASPGPGRAKRALLVYAAGGLRSSAAFRASPSVDLNPWGVWTQAGSITLGNLLRSDPSVQDYSAPSWPSMRVPPIEEAAREWAIVAATDHAPDGSPRGGDHTDDGPRMSTGYFGNPTAAGLLTVINRALGATAAAPIATIGGAFNDAPGDWLSSAPTSLIYYELPRTPPTGGRANVGRRLEDALDARFASRLRAHGKRFLDTFAGTKATLRRFGPLLAEPYLHMNENPDADLGGVTNRMLMEAVAGPSPQGFTDGDSKSIALALRLLQLGSPAVSVRPADTFDLHDDEESGAPIVYSRFARYMAGIHFALANVPDPDGSGSLLDSTLVVTTSEFGRNAHPGGFNEGHGSDHGQSAGWRNQAHVVFGAGVRPKVLNPTDDANEATERAASTHSLLATIACAVGVDQSFVDAQWPPGAALYPEGRPIWELWE